MRHVVVVAVGAMSSDNNNVQHITPIHLCTFRTRAFYTLIHLPPSPPLNDAQEQTLNNKNRYLESLVRPPNLWRRCSLLPPPPLYLRLFDLAKLFERKVVQCYSIINRSSSNKLFKGASIYVHDYVKYNFRTSKFSSFSLYLRKAVETHFDNSSYPFILAFHVIHKVTEDYLMPVFAKESNEDSTTNITHPNSHGSQFQHFSYLGSTAEDSGVYNCSTDSLLNTSSLDTSIKTTLAEDLDVHEFYLDDDEINMDNNTSNGADKSLFCDNTKYDNIENVLRLASTLDEACKLKLSPSESFKMAPELCPRNCNANTMYGGDTLLQELSSAMYEVLAHRQWWWEDPVPSGGIEGVKVVGRLGDTTTQLEGPRDAMMSATSHHASPLHLPHASPLHLPHAKVSGSCDSSSCSGGGGQEEEFHHDTADYQWLLDYDSPGIYASPTSSHCSFTFRDNIDLLHDKSIKMTDLNRDNNDSAEALLCGSAEDVYRSLLTIAELHDTSPSRSHNILSNRYLKSHDDLPDKKLKRVLPLHDVTNCRRYRESYTRESLGGSARGDHVRVSILDPNTVSHLQDLSYETLSRNLDANLAEIDMDEFRSDDINQLLSMPNGCQQCRCDGDCTVPQTPDEEDEEGSVPTSPCPHHHQTEEPLEEYVEDEELYSGVSGDISLYQSGPLFSPLKDPPPPTTFSVDSLDCGDSFHEDLILTCQANKDNYTIAFEGSFVQYSEDSDYHEAVESDTATTTTTTSGSWSAADRGGGGRSPAPATMTHSDQPYTTWSRVGRKTSATNTPEHNNKQNQQQHLSPANVARKHRPSQLQQPKDADDDSKSNSMPNLMRRSLMRQSLDTHCVKVFDLQNSLRSSRPTEGNSFSLVRLFMKQKSLSKEAISLSSSCTSRSQEGASSSDNQSAVESSDWPMNSQSDEMEGSQSPVRHYRRRSSDFPNDNTTNIIDTESHGAMVNNNNTVNQLLDNAGNLTTFDNIQTYEDSKEVCSKPPVTSPIREEPEGMDISFDSRSEDKLLNDQSESETKTNGTKTSTPGTPVRQHGTPVRQHGTPVRQHGTPVRQHGTPVRQHGTPVRQHGTPVRRTSVTTDERPHGTSNRISRREERQRHDAQHVQRPRPKPRGLKQMADQCLQTSNLKVSAAMNTSNLMGRKDVYVYYPNYALPDLSFLKDKKYNVDARIFLVPQHYNRPNVDARKIREGRSRRPFSCNDMERLKKKGLNHVKDWDSLNVLLPKELKEMLSDNTDCMETVKPSFCSSPRPSRRPVSCGDLSKTDIKTSSSSLTSTHPSSGYRGSSTMLADSQEDSTDQPPAIPKRSVSLPHPDEVEEGDESERAPPRPPLPRGILRKTSNLRGEDKSNGAGLKKRRSKDDEMACSCTSNCTGFCGNMLKKKNLLRLGELPEVSSHEELSEQGLAALRSKVSNFLAEKSMGEDSSCDCRKSVSFGEKGGYGVNSRQENEMNKSEERPVVYDAQDKKTLVMSVRSAVEKILSNKGDVSQVTLNKLCPAVYALLSDGLLPTLHSLFGRLNNSVWRVVEATSHMGCSTKALTDLVMSINSEDCLTEGPMKFNAFIFGLLNIRSLDSWLSYLRMRESALQKHYHPEAFLYLANTATRALYDDLLMALRPLALTPPLQLDLLYEYKLLHASLLKMEERLMSSTTPTGGGGPLDHLLVAKETKELRNSSTAAQQHRVQALIKVLASPVTSEGGAQLRSSSPRPRSCYENEESGDVDATLKKRWSNVQLGSKLVTAIDKLMLEDDSDAVQRLAGALREMATSDVTERSATDKDIENEKGMQKFGSKESEGEKFRRLQLKWERLAGDAPDSNTITATPGVTVPQRVVSPSSGTRSRIPRPVTSPQRPYKAFDPTPSKGCPQIRAPLHKTHPKPTPRRSLKDKQDDSAPVRPPRLPAGGKASPVVATGNRASSMPGVRNEGGGWSGRVVQTLHHRLATDNGHLSFSRGDLLTVMVEVDERYLLCATANRKGLVPRASVVVCANES